MAVHLSLTHYNRGDSWCPLCYASLVWRKVGERKYCPCDKQPVICLWDHSSSSRVVYRGEFVSGVKILTKYNASQFVGKKTFYALQPHVFTCPVAHRLTAFKQYENLRD